MALQAALQAAEGAGAASPAPGAPGTASGGSATAAPGGAATAMPGAAATTTPGGAATTMAPGDAASADAAAVAEAFMAAVDAASMDQPEQVMRLFVTGLAACDVDLALGRAMMGYALRSNLASKVAASPTGYEPQAADEIYFRTLERDTKLGHYYFDSPENAMLPFDEAAPHVVIDAEYKADDKGLSADGKMWSYYLKVDHPSMVRSRPVRLQRDGDRGWRVSNYSSLMVQP
jgi:hypothetical protein